MANMSYRPPGVYVENIPNPRPSFVNQPSRVLAVIGEGITTKRTTEAVYRQKNEVIDELTHEAVNVVSVGDSFGSKDYFPNVDYIVTNGRINWSPGGNSPTPAGSLAAGNYFYVVQPFTDEDVGVLSPEWAIEATTSTGAITVSWAETEGATGYYLYRGTSSGDWKKLATVAGTTSYYDDGSSEPAGAVEDATDLSLSTSIKLASFNPGTVYYVTYDYKKSPIDYEPTILSENALYEKHGEANTKNTLSLGAKFAFSSGAEAVLAVQVEPSGAGVTVNDFKNAIDKLRHYDVDYVVAITTDEDILDYLVSHVKAMSDKLNRKERKAVIALPKNSTKEDLINKARSLKSELVILLAPSKGIANVKNHTSGRFEDLELDMSYAAASLAGAATARHVADPWTRKPLALYKKLVDAPLPSEMNELSQAGCCVLYQETPGSQILVRHGVTTDTSDVDKAEISTVQIKHQIQKGLRNVLDPVFIGSRQTPDTAASIGSVAKVYLTDLLDSGSILAFEEPNVTADVSDPTAFNVLIRILPARGINWIDIGYQLVV